MTNVEILRKAIDKAVENSWLNLDLQLLSKDYICILDNKIHILGAFKHPIFYSLLEIVFSHSFAKAFWHDEDWQHHLQQMVLEENPLQYLAKFLDEEKQ